MLFKLQSLHNEQYMLYNHEQEYQHIFQNMKHHLNSKDCNKCTNLATKIMKVQDIYNFVKVKTLINYFLVAHCKKDCKKDCKRDCKRLTNYSIALFIKNILQKSLHYNFKKLSSLWIFFMTLLIIFNFNEHLKWYDWALLCHTESNLWSFSRIKRLLFKSTYSRIYQRILKSSLI